MDIPERTIHCFDPDYPDQPCPICQGLGVVKYNVPVEHPRFGKLFRCPNNPLEQDDDRQERLRKLSNLDAFTQRTFENFEVDVLGYSTKEAQSLKTALHAARRYADEMSGWLLLEGSYGTGKTHLAAAVGNTRLIQGDGVLFITTPDLLDHLRSTYAPRSESTYDELFERIRNERVLILDDLGVENPSEWAQEKLFQLLNHRYSHRLPTIITTNVELEKLDPRIRSRLMDLNVIQRVIIDAPDYRNMQANQSQQVLVDMGHYSDKLFENFDFETNATTEEHNSLVNAVKAAFEFAEQSQRGEQKWLMIMGTHGRGKTHLAAAIANYRRDRGEEVMMVTASDLLDHLRRTFAPTSDVTFDKLFDQVRNVPLLILDDLGTQSSEWAQEKLFQLLDYRYVSKKETVITTSRDFDQLNARLVSRLMDDRICRNVFINAPMFFDRMKRRR